MLFTDVVNEAQQGLHAMYWIPGCGMEGVRLRSESLCRGSVYGRIELRATENARGEDTHIPKTNHLE